MTPMSDDTITAPAQDQIIAELARLESGPLTRDALYEAVWKTPMRSLAIRYGCSDRGLAKLCARYEIPVPPRGYWAKVAAGHRVRRTPLPTLSEDQCRALDGMALPVPNPRKAEAGSEAARLASELEAQAATGRPSAATTADARTAPTRSGIVVRDSLRGAHALVVKTRECFDAAWKDDRGILHPDGSSEHPTGALAVHVSKASIHRALRITDALLRAIEARGWTIRCPSTDKRGTGVQLLGEEVVIAIEEKVKRFEHPKEKVRVTKGRGYDVGYGPYETVLRDPYPRYGYEQLGQLALRVPWFGSPRFQIADGARQRIEDRIGDFLVGLEELAELDREARRQREECERQRKEQERRRREAERQRAEEAARVAALEKEVAAWRRAEHIRAFVAAARAAEPMPAPERLAYLEWALAQAGQLDPLVLRWAEQRETATVGAASLEPSG